MSITDKLKTHAPWVFFKEDAPNIATTADKISGIIVSGEKDENGKFKLDTLKVPICQVCPCGTAKKYCYFLYESKCHTEVNPDTNTTTTVWSTPVLVSNTGVCGNLTEAEQTWYWYEYGTVRKYVKAQKLTADGVYEDAQCSTDKACELSEDLIAACDRPAFTECCGELPIKAPIQELPHTFTPVTVTNLDGTSRTFQKKVYTDIAKENKISLISYYEGQSHRTYAAATDEQWITWTVEFSRVEGKLILRTEYIGKDAQGNSMYKDIELNWDSPDTSDPSLVLSTYTESGVTLYRMVKKLMPTQKVYMYMYTDEAAGANAEWDKVADAWEKDPDAELDYYTAEYGVQLEKSEWCIEYGFITFAGLCTKKTYSGLPPSYAKLNSNGSYRDAEPMDFVPKSYFNPEERAAITMSSSDTTTCTENLGTPDVPDGEIVLSGDMDGNFTFVSDSGGIGIQGDIGQGEISGNGIIRVECTGCTLLSTSASDVFRLKGSCTAGSVSVIETARPDREYLRYAIARVFDTITGTATFRDATLNVQPDTGGNKRLHADSVKVTFENLNLGQDSYGYMDYQTMVYNLLQLPYVHDHLREFPKDMGGADPSKVPTSPSSISCMESSYTQVLGSFTSYSTTPSPYNSSTITWTNGHSGWVHEDADNPTGGWRPANGFKDKEVRYIIRLRASVHYPAWYADGGHRDIDPTTPEVPNDNDSSTGGPSSSPPIFCCKPKVIRRMVARPDDDDADYDCGWWGCRKIEYDYGLLGPYLACPDQPIRTVVYLQSTGISQECKTELIDQMSWQDVDGGYDSSKDISRCPYVCMSDVHDYYARVDIYGRLTHQTGYAGETIENAYDTSGGAYVNVWGYAADMQAYKRCATMVNEIQVGCYTNIRRSGTCGHYGSTVIQWPTCNDMDVDDPESSVDMVPAEASFAINNLPEDLR